MKAYRGIAKAVAGLVVLQASFIALALFTIDKRVDDGKKVDDSYDNLGQALHGVGGLLIAVLTIALVVTSLFTKTAGASKRALMVLGAVVLQFALAFVAFAVPGVGALHGINAFVVIGAAVYASRLSSAQSDGAQIAAQRTAPASTSETTAV